MAAAIQGLPPLPKSLSGLLSFNRDITNTAREVAGVSLRSATDPSAQDPHEEPQRQPRRAGSGGSPTNSDKTSSILSSSSSSLAGASGGARAKQQLGPASGGGLPQQDPMQLHVYPPAQGKQHVAVVGTAVASSSSSSAPATSSSSPSPSPSASSSISSCRSGSPSTTVSLEAQHKQHRRQLQQRERDLSAAIARRQLAQQQQLQLISSLGDDILMRSSSLLVPPPAQPQPQPPPPASLMRIPQPQLRRRAQSSSETPLDSNLALLRQEMVSVQRAHNVCAWAQLRIVYIQGLILYYRTSAVGYNFPLDFVPCAWSESLLNFSSSAVIASLGNGAKESNADSVCSSRSLLERCLCFHDESFPLQRS